MHDQFPRSMLCKLVVKIGSESIGSNVKLENLARDIAEIKSRIHWRIYVVTSGAVLHGKLALGMKPDTEVTDQEKQKLAAIGQAHLMHRWNEALHPHGLYGAQIMTTHALLSSNTGIREGFLSSLESFSDDPKVVPIINENDPITPEEIKQMKYGADNDQNALLIAKMTKANYLAILTNTDGVRIRPNDTSSRMPIIRGTTLNDAIINKMTENDKSSAGTGGMKSKLEVVQEASRNFIGSYIYDGVNSSLVDFINSKEIDSKVYGGTIIL